MIYYLPSYKSQDLFTLKELVGLLYYFQLGSSIPELAKYVGRSEQQLGQAHRHLGTFAGMESFFGFHGEVYTEKLANELLQEYNRSFKVVKNKLKQDVYIRIAN